MKTELFYSYVSGYNESLAVDEARCIITKKINEFIKQNNIKILNISFDITRLEYLEFNPSCDCDMYAILTYLK